MVVSMWGVKAGRLDERRPDSRAKSRWGCGRMNPILMGSTLPIVKAMGGRVKRLYEVKMKIRRRNVWDEECERWCESQDDNCNQRDVALVYTWRHTRVMATRVFPDRSASANSQLHMLCLRHNKNNSFKINGSYIFTVIVHEFWMYKGCLYVVGSASLGNILNVRQSLTFCQLQREVHST